MPYTTDFIDDMTGVLHVGSGVVLGIEVLAGTIEVHRDAERARRLAYSLVDLTEALELRITPEELRQIAIEDHRNAAVIPRLIVAIVAPRDHPFGMARMWEAFVEDINWRTGVFRTRSEARDWLRDQLSPPE
jgi:hypothetical protein